MNIATINQKMMRNVFLNTEILLNEDENEIFEYDIQAFMFLFFRRYLKRTEFHAEREKEGKVDCVLFKNDKPVVFYEIKTYFKSREQIKKSHIDHDLRKLADLLERNQHAIGYFFTSGLKAKYTNTYGQRIEFINNRLKGLQTWEPYKIPDGKKVRLRPSRYQPHGVGITMAWEVKLS